MAINIKNIEELLQKKAYAVDSATPVSDLADMIEAALLSTNSLQQYDSAGLLPTASSTNVKIAFISSDKSVRFNIGGKWDSLTSGGARVPVPVPPTPPFQGSSYGYASGGTGPVSQPANVNTIQKFSFTSDANATDVGDLTGLKRYGAGNSSSENGYYAGGYTTTSINEIEKFPFSTDTNATDVGDLTESKNGHQKGQNSTTHGYVTGAAPYTNVIQKFSFSVDGNATDVGDLIFGAQQGSEHSSTTDGYYAGGRNDTPSPYGNQIQKFPFATDGNATDIGDLTNTVWQTHGQNSDTHGYTTGGQTGNPSATMVNVIQKFSFSVDENASDVADLYNQAVYAAPSSSTTHGYLAGGFTPTTVDIIQKFSTTSDANGTDVANLTTALYGLAGQQV